MTSTKNVHENSIESYCKCLEDDDFTRIVYRIAHYYHTHRDQAFTDRELSERMLSAGLLFDSDMNMVRPKITNLIKVGLLRQLLERKFDENTERHVRLVQWSGGL